MKDKVFVLLICIILIFCQGCSTLRYVKEHPYKTLGCVAGAALIVTAVVAQAYSQSYQSQPVYYPNTYQPAQISQPVYYNVPQPIRTQQLSIVSPSGGQYLGKFSSNKYDPQSISNPYGQYGSKYSSTSINNPYGQYGSPYSSKSVNNPYTTDSPKLYGQDGKYLGKLSCNPFDPESISNPYGEYGSPYSLYSVNNPYSKYGSSYSSQSANNPYTTDAPVVIYKNE